MTRDFTLAAFRALLEAGTHGGYTFRTFERFLQSEVPEPGVIVMRHDVDRHPARSLRTAQLEHEAGISGTYYFRIVPGAFDPGVIRAIHALGHEVGYHYEDLALAHGDLVAARASFERNLNRVRAIAPVRTICMHGSPTSSWDNRALWHDDSYTRFDILGEPYFDVDFTRTAYLTDTGRRWDGTGVSVRDKVAARHQPILRSTPAVAAALRSGALGRSIMITVHPQRWVNALLPWLGEAVAQPAKNAVKRLVVRRQPSAPVAPSPHTGAT